jgi:hypothetical protein
MKKFIKKQLSLLLAMLLLVSSLLLGIFVFAEDEIEINPENFPDTNFRNAVALMYDENGDGYLSKSERNTESMIVSGIIETYAFENNLDEDELPVNSLKGIEFFDNLKSLRCSSIGSIETLDVSSLDKLETLACNDLGLTSIDLSENKALSTLNICSNSITELDVSDNTNLKKLHCYSNDNLEALNINGLSNLEELRCDNCKLSFLDLSTNTKLSYLNCSYNRLTKLDLSNNTGLISSGNDITEYNIGHQSASAFIEAENSLIIVPLDLEQNRIVSTNLDINETVAYSNGYFYTEDSDNLINGIDYKYNTGISDSALLSVHLNLTEKQHYYSLCSFDFNKNCGEIKCPICKDSYLTSFENAINARQGSKKYEEHLDVNKDGIINAKDYSLILRQFN